MDEDILLIEDDPAILMGLQLNLGKAGYRVRVAIDGPKGLRAFNEQTPDLVVLDLMLPGLDGLEILRRIRAQNELLPVVVLTAMAGDIDKVRGLDLGANDYVTKPFSVAELLARIRAALRTHNVHRQEQVTQVLRTGSLEMDLERRVAKQLGDPLDLTAREFDLLLFMVQRPERVITRQQLLSNLWGDEYEGTERTVDNYISALRRKLGEDTERPRHLQTVWGIGYRFVP